MVPSRRADLRPRRAIGAPRLLAVDSLVSSLHVFVLTSRSRPITVDIMALACRIIGAG